MDACGGFMRCALYLINFVMSLAGIIIVILVALAMKELRNSEEKGVATVLIVVGCFIIFIAILGCCGIYHESRCMTITYLVIMFILLVVQIAMGVIANRNAENRNAKNVGTGSIVLGVIELVAVIFSGSLAFTFNNQRRRNSF